MVRIVAVDDELHVLERFKRMVDAIEGVELCGLFQSSALLLDYLKDHTVEAVFLDIEMPVMNGLELSQHLLDLNLGIDIVFMTAFNQYAVEAFEHEAMDYLLKPVSADRLEKTIKRLIKKRSGGPLLETLMHSKMQDVHPSKHPFIQCIGDFEVFVDNEALSWKNSKAKEILAFLVYKNGVPVNWEKIADAIWPEYNAEKAQTNFHANMYLLRKRLSDAGISHILECGRGNYRVYAAHFSCDILMFEAMVKGDNIKRKEDLVLVKQVKQKGYMYASGYDWARPKAAELDDLCDHILDHWGRVPVAR